MDMLGMGMGMGNMLPQQGQPAQPPLELDPELLKAIILFLQLMAGQGKIPEGILPPAQVPQVQIPQVGAEMGGMYGQRGNMYGQLANMFRDFTQPSTPGMGTFSQ